MKKNATEDFPYEISLIITDADIDVAKLGKRRKAHRSPI